MSDIELYVFEDAEGDIDTFTTFDADEARNYALRYQRRWVAQIFEYADSQVVEDFLPTETPDE